MSAATAKGQASAVATIFVDYDLDPSYEPQLIFRSLDTKVNDHVTLRRDDQISWRILGPKYCIGFHSKDEYHHYEPCPASREIQLGTQCAKCKANDVLFPCMICDGSTCHAIEKMKDICDVTTTSIYITVFDTFLKVGVSKKDRLIKRWLEQGADFAAEVAVIPNGMLAREIESKISQTLEISKGVRFSKKVNNIKFPSSRNNTNNQEIALSEITTRLDLISKWITKEYGSQYAVESPVLNDLSSYYTFKPDKHAIRLDVSNIDTLAGSFKGMKGSIFCIGNKDSDYLLDIRDFRGYQSHFGDFIADHLILTNQRSIADYFG